MKKMLFVAALISAAALAQVVQTKQFIWKMEAVRPAFTLQNMTPEERQAAMEHGRYLMTLQAQGKLSHAVQIFDPKGLWGVIVVSAASLEEATAMLNNDPFMKAGVFRGEVIPARLAIDACITGAPAPGTAAPPAK